MTLYHVVISLFALVSVATSIAAIVSVLRSNLGFKAVWIISSLFGFVGLGINWTKPDDLILLFGVQIPPVTFFSVLGTQSLFAKVMFPIGALAALAKSLDSEEGKQDSNG